MKTINLGKGNVAYVDNEDYEKLLKFKWRLSKECNTCYAVCNYSTGDGKQHTLRMHREIMKHPKGFEIDHINHNGLDNRKKNLRICTRSQNARNRRGINKNNESGLLGVSWDSSHNKWKAQIQINNKRTHLGYFDNKEDASKIFNKKSKEIYGDFATLNN